jgi:diphthine synthase
MTFHLIGLGLGTNTITSEAKEILKQCETTYLESYTVNFPYKTEELEDQLQTKIKILTREDVENETILEEAKERKIALLVYGDSLSATTHTQLILSCKKQNIPYKIHHNASILTAVAQTGLQLYKFGKTASMPAWEKNHEPTSFLNYYTENQSIKAHTLILTDIGLELNNAINQLEKSCKTENVKIEKLIIISNAGLKTQKIYHDTIEKIKTITVPMPYAIIIPSKLHFIEEEAIETFKEKI